MSHSHICLVRLPNFRPTPMPDEDLFPEVYDERAYGTLEIAQVACQNATDRLWINHYGHREHAPPRLVWERLEDLDPEHFGAEWFPWKPLDEEAGWVGSLSIHHIYWSILKMPLRDVTGRVVSTQHQRAGLV